MSHGSSRPTRQYNQPTPSEARGLDPPNTTHAEANLCRHIVVARTTPGKQIRISIQVTGSGSGVRSTSALFQGLDAAQKIGAIVDSAPNPPFEVTISKVASRSTNAALGTWQSASLVRRCTILLVNLIEPRRRLVGVAA